MAVVGYLRDNNICLITYLFLRVSCRIKTYGVDAGLNNTLRNDERNLAEARSFISFIVRYFAVNACTMLSCVVKTYKKLNS